MKKLFILMLILLFALTGCAKGNDTDYLAPIAFDKIGSEEVRDKLDELSELEEITPVYRYIATFDGIRKMNIVHCVYENGELISTETEMTFDLQDETWEDGYIHISNSPDESAITVVSRTLTASRNTISDLFYAPEDDSLICATFTAFAETKIETGEMYPVYAVLYSEEELGISTVDEAFSSAAIDGVPFAHIIYVAFES